MFDFLRKNSSKSATPTPSIDGIFNVVPYAAPDISGVENWINSDPLTLKDLLGKVVLIKFWTYGCINCVRTLPHVNDWYGEFKPKGFEVIGLHAPEFEAEKELHNVQRNVQQRKIEYPVVQDNKMATWRAYGNNYWPAHYLIDKQGMVRRVHFGEGEYEEMRTAIKQLLTE